MGLSPAQYRDDKAAKVARAVGQLLWVLIPVWTLSFLAFVPAAHAYWRARTLGWLLAVGALIAGSTSVGIMAAAGADGAGPGFMMIGTACGGVVAAALGRPIVFGDQGPKIDPAVGQALDDRTRREQSRAIVDADPPLAVELGIGRPDVPTEYDDGGLVDLNNATADGIVQVLGWNRDTAEVFVADRDARHGFTSLTEIMALSGLPPKLLDIHADRTVLLPYRQHG